MASGSYGKYANEFCLLDSGLLVIIIPPGKCGVRKRSLPHPPASADVVALTITESSVTLFSLGYSEAAVQAALVYLRT